jgi:hypothetical protein
MEFVFVLGAADPEMARIDAVLAKHGCFVAYATAGLGGERVAPSTAYKADRTTHFIEDLDGRDLIFVECQVSGLTPKMVIDHHRPGDPGYGLPPEKFWEASSLGQVFSLLGLKPSEEDLIVAAADHCLSHAYRGRCPGVNPDALRRWRTASRAAFQGVSEEEIRRKVGAALMTLSHLPHVAVAGQMVANAIGLPPIPEAPEAVAISGTALMYSMPDKGTGRTKVGLLGAEPETIREWMTVAHKKWGLIDIYGDPARGYAGGYLP